MIHFWSTAGWWLVWVKTMQGTVAAIYLSEGLEFQGLGIFPGVDLSFFPSIDVTSVSSPCTKGGETPSAPRPHHCGLFCHFTDDLWVIQATKLFRESRKNPTDSCWYLISSSVANVYCCEQTQQNMAIGRLWWPISLVPLEDAALSGIFFVGPVLCNAFWVGTKRLQPTSEAEKNAFHYFFSYYY